MLKFLNKPYPFNDDLKHNAKITFFISIGILVFLIVFQPINIKTFSIKEIIYLLSGLTVLTFLVLAMNLIVLPALFPKLFISSKWNIKKEIIWNSWILITISGSEFLLYSYFLGVFNITFIDVAKIVLLGILTVSVLIVINHERLVRNHLSSAQQLNDKLLESKQQKERLIYFDSDYKNDNLIIKSNAIVLIKSADNYVEIYYTSENIVIKKMVRTSLIKVEELLKDYKNIFKCHRSFIVNIDYIKKI